MDTDVYHLQETLERAGNHKGGAFIEVLQNCNIYNDGAWRAFTDREVRDDRMLVLKHGEPMIFGKNQDKGIRLNGLMPEVVELGKDGITEKDILVHDETTVNPTIHFMLSRMDYPEFPVPAGVIRAVKRDTYNDLMDDQMARAMATAQEDDLEKLFLQGDTWTVE